MSEKPVRVRIEDNGSPFNTKITDIDTGKPIHATSVVWEASGINIPTAKITVFMPVVDVITDAEIKKLCPCCGREATPEQIRKWEER